MNQPPTCYCAECDPQRHWVAVIGSIFGLLICAALVVLGVWMAVVWVLTA